MLTFNKLQFRLQATEPTRLYNNYWVKWLNPSLSPTLSRNIETSRELILGLQSSNDVANLLEIPVGQLLYILYTLEPKYKSFTVTKKSGKKRLIDSPNESIKILQDKVRPLIEAHYRVKKPVHGFVGGGKGIVTNAMQHKKKNYVLNIDLSDFFHSVNFGRVQGIFRNAPFNMGSAAATVLAQLCTHNKCLPQGASTSPVLSNLAASTLDRKLVQLAKKFHLTYTRYADDITFSSNKPFSGKIVENRKEESGLETHRVGKLLEQIITDSGFQVNHTKTRLQYKSQRQEVTGLVVNEGVNVNRKFIRKTRAMIHEWSNDLISAEARFIMQRYNVSDSEVGNDRDGSIFKRAVYGNLSFIKMVKGEEHSPYLNLCRKVLELDNEPPSFISKLKDVLDMYDVFICHARENKNEVAIPLYEALKSKGINTFIDSSAINWGDSLVSKINTALQKAKYVIAIISDDSLNKSWPMHELRSVLSTEIRSGEIKLLPLMVGDADALISQIPLLADKRFIHFEDNIDDVVEEIQKLLKD
ncbi:Reverse transcriptase (RNA-dependent DNA polymerase) [Pseudoalteromonas sp. P1-26]|uniref:TIR domain-containing anti-phage reverse transcriptase n=1 Tax=Pseudoalteromonas sp. P1-26 TaxID=1723759 RepID=UPI0006D6745A|nr:TIR domain-containing anti-phage reverse transcriptase [Pseudoalteromonas sp. P1-26]KPZ74681.1 Reverse transcriptase (RNA-dependent DNA polymerase) [Pseudoalteromonas sp. P1-26]